MADDTGPNVPTAEERLTALVKNAGTEGACKSCLQPIRWIKHAGGTGANAPYDPPGSPTVGVNHFVTCPSRNQHRPASRKQ